jgi:hypothetical protein
MESMMAMHSRAAANQAKDLDGLLDTDFIGLDMDQL